MNFSLSNTNKVAINLFSVAILLFIFRGAISFWKYPFILIYVSIAIITFYKYTDHIIPIFKRLFKYYLIILILELILLLAFILSGKLYLEVFKDLLNSLILLSLFFFLMFYVSTRIGLTSFLSSILNVTLIFAFLISVSNLIRLLNIVQINYGFYGTLPSGVPTGEYEADYNFVLLPVFFGMVYIFYLLDTEKSRLKIYILTLLQLVFTLSIFLSGSRRGFITLIIIIAGLLLIQFISYVIKNKICSRIALSSRLYLISLVLFVSIFWIIISNTGYAFKNSILRCTGSKSILTTKENIASIILRYVLIVNSDVTYQKVYNDIWSPVFNPEDPDSSWGSKIHKTVFPLIGKNVEIVPGKSKGYLLDKTSQSGVNNGNSFSYTQIAKMAIEAGCKINSSVYCYVSDDFDGNWVSLSVGGSVSGTKINEYNLNEKGYWQKLEVDLTGEKGEAIFYLNFAKYGVKDLSSLNGHVVFAYPTITVYDKNGTLITETKLSLDILGIKNSLMSKQFLNVQRENDLKYSKMFNAGIFLSVSQQTEIIDKDPIRNLIARIVSKDSIYPPYHSTIGIDTTSYNIKESRLLRWMFAIEIFRFEYTWPEKIFGGGFSFLSWYGRVFLKDETKTDYPHNPFLYILLYSGIIGLMFYICLIVRVFYLYYKYLKYSVLFFLFFAITYFFSISSGGSPLDPPVMGFFIILPFFLHSIIEEEDKSLKN